MNGTNWYRWEDGDLILNLRVQPRAKRDEVLGPQGDHLRVRITAPPVEGKANEHLCRLLADILAVPRSQVVLVAGGRGRLKRLRIHAPAKLPEAIQPGARLHRGR
ncbi:MAG: DUF167 family protein [Chromatiaceae bacterium]